MGVACWLFPAYRAVQHGVAFSLRNTPLRLVAVSIQAAETGADLTKQANFHFPAQNSHVFRNDFVNLFQEKTFLFRKALTFAAKLPFSLMFHY